LKPETPFFDQHEYDIRCEWAIEGITALVPTSDAVIIVDVLSFSTAVDIAVGNGATVYPYRLRDESAVAYAESLGALLASPTRNATSGYSLAPSSLLEIPPGTRLVLPSPNGSTLSLATGHTPTFTGCLRNAAAVAAAAQKLGTRISVIPAGERWQDGTLRPAIEDLIGAGAIVHHLAGTKSPEALAAESVYKTFAPNLLQCLQQCTSGKELIALGFATDLPLAAALNASNSTPLLINAAYTTPTP
jgi:2-phosphosulfolactate phosphatase